MLLVFIPGATYVIQTWGFKDEMFVLRLNLIINTVLVGAIKGIGMILVDTEDNYISNLPEQAQEVIQEFGGKSIPDPSTKDE